MGYYSDNLSGLRLKECYDIAPPRIVRYLESEIKYVRSLIDPNNAVLEMGCGYGRIMLRIADAAESVVGIDTSPESLELARFLAAGIPHLTFLKMDAVHTAFPNDSFDRVICVQNGICAFNVDRIRLVREALRITKPGGKAIFSSYSSQIWTHRLKWFELQAERGLLGPIDYKSTGRGVIVCQDGFRAGAMTRAKFQKLGSDLGCEALITEVDKSSLFCVFTEPFPKQK